MNRPYQLGFVHVHGADAATFLNGQFSHSTLDMAPGDHRIGAFCTAKGRTIAVAHLLRHDEHFDLWTSTDVLDDLVTSLQRYVMRANVTFDTPTSPAANTIVVIGDNLATLDLAADDVASRSVTLGVPTVVSATREQFVPQMINLDLLAGIDFAKGCYTGQEIIARTHNLGTIKRRMLGFACADADALSAGDDLLNDQDDRLGQIVSSGGDMLLAVVRLAALSESLTAGPNNVAVGDMTDLPYRIPEYDALTT